MALTIEDFANRCLRISGGDISLVAPCCANCKYYKSITFSDGETIYECHHPETEDSGDEYVSCALCMAPEDFCSRFEERTDG